MNQAKDILRARLRKEGRWDDACLYRDGVVRSLRDHGDPNYMYRDEAWEMMEKEYPPLEPLEPEPEPEEEITSEVIAGMEFLPEFMRWVALHPALGISASKETDKIRSQIVEYEQEYQCPNQASRTLLADCRRNETQRSKFFSDLVKQHFEDMKAGNKDDNAVVVAERKRIKKLEDVFGLTKPA